MADGRHREAEFFRGFADAAEAGDDIECQHTLERWEMHGFTLIRIIFKPD